MLRNKKGVSPVIAVVLMIVVAVAISLVVYVWASGFVSEKTGAESKAGDYSFLVETRDVNSTNIRNTGIDIDISGTNGLWDEFDLYVNNVLKSPSSGVTEQDGNNVWAKGEVVTIDFDTAISASAGDKIKLVHKDSGTPIVFKLE
ncbi:MAG TPA: type IV pilin [Euryarchaeota archaeon]|nr:type IV pilin [Euryarchaeota archaeon]